MVTAVDESVGRITQTLARLGIEATVEPDLREVFLGDWEGGLLRRRIADDDPIFQIPFTFPNGPPPLWFHGGKQTMGVKYRGRWAVFYFPGDMNDAWKSQGYTDVTPEMRRAAMNLGVNIVYYAFNAWDDAVAKMRK